MPWFVLAVGVAVILLGVMMVCYEMGYRNGANDTISEFKKHDF